MSRKKKRDRYITPAEQAWRRRRNEEKRKRKAERQRYGQIIGAQMVDEKRRNEQFRHAIGE